MSTSIRKEAFDGSFKARLRMARDGAGLTQLEVATALKIPQNTYAKYENRGKSTLPTYLVAKFCLATNCDLWYLLANKKLTEAA